MAEAALLARRLATFRRANPGRETAAAEFTGARHRSQELVARLVATLDAEAVTTPLGTVVRIEGPARAMAIDRKALARLPGQPPSHVPFICLDTETTGLATAAGTLAFLVGLGWWEGQRFRQVQLLLPDQPEEPALLELLASVIPPDAWLVTYNGRGFDWPLLVARYRMARRDAPVHAGHLDLLGIVRRLFRHRMTDARLRTVEEALLGIGRVNDVEGWEIPGRYLAFLRGGGPAPLIPVVEHNDHDVRSLARLLCHLAEELGDEGRRRTAPDGDLLGLARAFRGEGRLDDAMTCLDLAVSRPPSAGHPPRSSQAGPPASWFVDQSDGIASAIARLSEARAARVIRDQLARERARLLRRLGRLTEAREAWHELAGRNGPLSAIAWVELAKLLEHVERDFTGALNAVASADGLAEQSAALGRPLPMLQADLVRRRARLERRRGADATSLPALLPSTTLRETVSHAVANG